MDKEIKCPNCKGIKVIKKGKRKVESGYRQIYFCKDCEKKFSDAKMPKRKYRPKIILDAITIYNLGSTLEETKDHIFKTYGVTVPSGTIFNWLNDFEHLRIYSRLHSKFLEKFGKDILVSKRFSHKGLTHNFKYHKPKLDKLTSNYPELGDYIKGFEKGCPSKFFDENLRCSELKLKVDVRKQGEKNLACRVASLVLKGVDDPRKRHEEVEKFMLVNDSSTIACEVPVLFWEKKIGGVAGHIDLLQIRYGRIHLLDFKPEATKERNAPPQLYLYALSLYFRTGIPLKKFKCAWFDDEIYYEFEPEKAKIGYTRGFRTRKQDTERSR